MVTSAASEVPVLPRGQPCDQAGPAAELARAAELLAAKVPEAVGLPGLTRCAPTGRAGTAPGPGLRMPYGYLASVLVLVLRGTRAG